MPNLNRRQFVASAGRITVAVAVSERLMRRSSPAAENVLGALPTYVAFTESFQGWPIPLVCEKFKGIGLDGLDLTVRPGGHIDPADAKKKLPAAVQAAQAEGLRIPMLTTAIVEADNQADELLAVAGSLGIDRVKLGYYPYQQFGTLQQQIDAVKQKLAGVAKLAARHKVLPCLHVHSGPTIPASGQTAYLVVKDFDPKELGAYVDPMHMTLEGGLDGWRQGLDLLGPWIAISSLKNAKWIDAGRDKNGQQRYEPRKCPLADGIAPIPQYLEALAKLGYRGLFTLHSEYADGNSWKRLNVDECLAQTRVDLEYARRVMPS